MLRAVRALVLVLAAERAVAGSCLSWKNDNTCSVCNLKLGYSTNAEKTCVIDPVVDSVYRAGANELMCASGIWSTTENCRGSAISSCLLQLNTSKCDICERDTYPVADRCDPLPPEYIGKNCVQFSETLDCLRCAAGYQLVGSDCQQVTTLGPNCVVGLHPTTCKKCNRNSFISSYDPLVDFWQKIFNLRVYGEFDTFQRSTCVPSQAINCLKAADLLTCEICLPGYFLTDAKTCEQADLTILHCLFFSSRSQCQACWPGFYLQNNACKPNPSEIVYVRNCINYSSRTECSRCDEGYYLGRKDCLRVPQPIANCKYYKDASHCDRCGENFYLKNNECLNDGLNGCAAFSSETDCLFCLPGYKLFQNSCIPVEEVVGCAAYDSNGNCTQCNRFSFLTATKTCKSTYQDKYCKAFGPGGECLLCEYYDLVDGECKDHAGTLVAVANCRGYENGACSHYKHNLVFQQSAAPLVRRIEGCFLQVDNFCEGCLPGFVNRVTHCEPSTLVISNCLVYDDEGCRVCVLDSPDPRNCSDPSTTTQIGNCFAYESSGSCRICEEGFQMERTNLGVPSCVPSAVGHSCKATRFNNPAECLVCSAGFYLDGATQTCLGATEKSFCLQDSRRGCVECAPGSELTADGLSCVSSPNPPISFCKAALNGKCIYCQRGFHPDDQGLCVAITYNSKLNHCESLEESSEGCKNCLTGFAHYESDCISIAAVKNTQPIEGCRNALLEKAPASPYTYEVLCELCDSNHFVVAAGCTAKTQPSTVLVKPPPNCLTFDVNWFCIECTPGFYLSGKVCLPYDNLNSCQTAETAVKCAFCFDRFYLTGGKCESRAANHNCFVFSDESTCAICNPGYYLSAGKCLRGKDIPGCKQLASADLCEVCELEFALSESKTQCIKNCFRASGELCAQCKSHFVQDASNECVSVSVEVLRGCVLISAAGVCLLCEMGFTLTQSGICDFVQSDENCKFAEFSPGKCALCAFGFVLDNEGNCVSSSQCSANGCMVCDQSDPSKCLVCSPDHYQVSSDGSCAPLTPAEKAIFDMYTDFPPLQ